MSEIQEIWSQIQNILNSEDRQKRSEMIAMIKTLNENLDFDENKIASNTFVTKLKDKFPEFPKFEIDYFKFKIHEDEEYIHVEFDCDNYFKCEVKVISRQGGFKHEIEFIDFRFKNGKILSISSDYISERDLEPYSENDRYITTEILKICRSYFY